jgi:hypothetical protein
MKRLAILFSTLAALPAAAALAQTGAPTEAPATVEIELREGDQLVGAPTLRLQVDRPAAVSVGSYSLRIRVARAPAAADGASPYVIRSSLYRSDSGWALVASPVLTVAQGGQARLDFAGSDGRALSMAVTLR